MSDKLLETKHEIVVTKDYCHSCARLFAPPFKVVVTSIESDDGGWTAKGKGRIINRRCRCPRCKMIYETVMKAIPIQTAPFPCPTCGELQDFEYKVQSIEADRESFQFEVSIVCGKCSKKRSLKKILKKLFEIIKVEVKPTGITIKNS
jgi:hypothetical protein